MINLKQILEGKDSEDAAGIAYFFNDTLLCCQNNEGKWGIPKGHIHIDETPEEGAHREFTEETQIILNKPIKFSHKSKKITVVILVFLCVKVIKNLYLV